MQMWSVNKETEKSLEGHSAKIWFIPEIKKYNQVESGRAHVCVCVSVSVWLGVLNWTRRLSEVPPFASEDNLFIQWAEWHAI